jgi:hypothetical protein
MEDFSITTQLTARDYSKAMLVGFYKRPSILLMAVFGFYLVITVILNYFNIINLYSEIPYFEMFGGLFILLLPPLIIIIAVRQFLSNPNFQKEIKYTFTENGMSVQGLTFKGEFLWAHIIKQREISNFLILYHSKKLGNFIDKRKLNLDQIEFIKSKVRKK